MATTAKGIRVSQLAKELNITSKAILDRIKKEGLPNPPVNAQSTISLGLAETVREWFANAPASAPELEAPVATVEIHDDEAHEAHKSKTHPRKKKKSDEDHDEEAPDAVQPPAEEPSPSPVVVEPPKPEPVPEAPAPVEPPMPEPAPVEPPASPVVVVQPPEPAPVAAPVVVKPAPTPVVAPAAQAPAVVPPARSGPSPETPSQTPRTPRQRPTVVIDEKTHQPHNKKPAGPAASPVKMHVPAPAKIQARAWSAKKNRTLSPPPASAPSSPKPCRRRMSRPNPRPVAA